MSHKFVDGITDLHHVRHVELGENYTRLLDVQSEVIFELGRKITPEELNELYSGMEACRPHISGHTLISRSVMKSIIGVVEVRLSHTRSILVYKNGEEVDVGCQLPTGVIEKIYELNREIRRSRKVALGKK